MSSKARSARRAAARANSPNAQQSGMTLPQVLTSLSNRIVGLENLIAEYEKVIEEHEARIKKHEERIKVLEKGGGCPICEVCGEPVANGAQLVYSQVDGVPRTWHQHCHDKTLEAANKETE